MPTLNSQGLTLAYEIQGTGQPVLLISGVGYGGWVWHKVVAELAQHYQVISFDNRGTGGSDKPDGPYTTAMLAADAIGLLEGLGLRDVLVVGHSLGGFIAQELTLARPDLVRKLVLASTTYGGQNVIPITPEALQVMTNRVGNPLEIIQRGIAIATAPGWAEQQLGAVQELVAYRMGNPVPPAQYSAQVMAGATHNAEARISAIACPTLVLFGAEDKVVPASNAPMLAQKIQGAQVKVIPNVGHLLPIEAPAEISRIIAQFFAA